MGEQDREWLKRQEISDLASKVADTRIDDRMKAVLEPFSKQIERIADAHQENMNYGFMLMGDETFEGEVPKIRKEQAQAKRRQRRMLKQAAEASKAEQDHFTAISARLSVVESRQNRPRRIVLFLWKVWNKKGEDGKTDLKRIVAWSGSALVASAYIHDHSASYLQRIAALIRAIKAVF